MTEIYNQEKGITLSAEKSDQLIKFKIFRDVIVLDKLKKKIEMTGEVDSNGAIIFKVYTPINSSEYFDGFCNILQWVSSELRKL